MSITDYSWKKLVNLAHKYGFLTVEGKKHTKVKDKSGRFITTIPRHNLLKREVIKSILQSFRQAKNSLK